MADANLLGTLMFAHGVLSPEVQRLVIDRAPEYRTAISGNPYGLTQPVWRACFTAPCSADRAKRLLNRPNVTPDDIDWVLRDVGERRPGPLEIILRCWTLDVDQQKLIVSGKLAQGSAETLAYNASVPPQVRLKAARSLRDPRVRLNILHTSPVEFLPDADVLAALADIDSWTAAPAAKKRGDAPQLASEFDPERIAVSLAELAYGRPGIREQMATSGKLLLASAAAQTALSSSAQQAALTTLTAALDDPNLTEVVGMGLLALLDRYDVTCSVRAAALEVVAASDELTRGMRRSGVAGARNPFPAGTPCDQLDLDQVEMLLLRSPDVVGLPARRMGWQDLASHPLLAADQGSRLLLTGVFTSSRSFTWLEELLGKFPQLSEFASSSLMSSAEQRAKELAKARKALAAAGTPGAVLTRSAGVPRPPAVREDAAAWTCKQCDITDKRGEEAGRWLAAELGDDPDAVLAAVRIADGFAGTLRELVDVARAVV